VLSGLNNSVGVRLDPALAAVAPHISVLTIGRGWPKYCDSSYINLCM